MAVAAALLGAGPALPAEHASGAKTRARYHESYRLEKARNYRGAIRVLAGVPAGYLLSERLGWLSYLSGDHAASRKYYQMAIKAAPASIEARLGYLLPLLAQRAYLEAESVAKQVLRMDGGNYYANLRLAYALRLQGKYGPAEEVANRMVRFYPCDAQFLTELGLLKLARNQRAAAKGIFERVLLLDPTNATAKAYAGTP